MAYDASDPRSRLPGPPDGTGTDTGDATVPAPYFYEFPREPPQRTSPAGSRTWFVRGQNLVLAYTELAAGDSLRRSGQRDEYAALTLHDGAHLRVEANSGSHHSNDSGGCHERERGEVRGQAFVVCPPGDSVLTAVTRTTVVRLFDARDTELAGLAANAVEYAEPHPRVAPLTPWPAPPGGHRLRVYHRADFPEEPGRFGTIFRCRSFMVNFLAEIKGPRDPEKLSPHAHADFEQFSLAYAGEHVHHLRTPWTTRRSQWREDVHRRIGSPSLFVIPPPAVHTSEAVGDGTNALIDIFGPPRQDFSAMPGWVLNAADYPTYEGGATS